jgi:hypothetical protein
MKSFVSRRLVSSFGALVAAAVLLASSSAWTQEDSYLDCPKVFKDPTFGAAWYREQCQTALREDRAQLEAWGIPSKGMTDLQVWDRTGAELKTRAEAKQAQERRDALERDRLAAQRAQADADQQRIQAQREKEANAAAAQQVQTFQKAIEQQNKTLQGLGVNLGGIKIPSGDDEDDDDATQIQMYKKMVDSGVAPQCKGKDGEDLIDCVDSALGEDDKN